MLPPRESQIGVLPLPEHRRRRIRPLMIAGVVALIAGRLLDISVVWGMGVGIVLVGTLVMFLDNRARRRQLP